MPFECRLCGGSFCMDHRLPENHSCPGLYDYRQRLRESGKLVYEPLTGAKVQKKSLLDRLEEFIPGYSVLILILVIVSFFLQLAIPGFTETFMLVPALIPERPWTLVTHMFLHSGPTHILFNMLTLYFFGPELERRIGGRDFLFVYFLSGILAGAGWALTSAPYAAALGASGALMGIFACLAVLAPDMRIYVYFVPMKITYALILFAALDFLLIGQNDAIAHTAHLSGVVAGLALGFQYRKRQRQYRFM